MRKRNTYRFEHLTPGLVLRDMRFGRRAPKAGAHLPNATLFTLDGRPISTGDITADRPALLIFGSTSCPMTIGSLPTVEDLHREFGRDVDFVTLYVREAHPGADIPQPETLEEKLGHARMLEQLHNIAWTVLADDLDGSLHRALDPKPNAAFLVDRDGRIAFRALWAGDYPALRAAIGEVVAQTELRKTQSQAMLRPLMQGIRVIDEVLTRAGKGAWRDTILAAPPIALAGAIVGGSRRLAARRRPHPLGECEARRHVRSRP